MDLMIEYSTGEEDFAANHEDDSLSSDESDSEMSTQPYGNNNNNFSGFMMAEEQKFSAAMMEADAAAMMIDQLNKQHQQRTTSMIPSGTEQVVSEGVILSDSGNSAEAELVALNNSYKNSSETSSVLQNRSQQFKSEDSQMTDITQPVSDEDEYHTYHFGESNFTVPERYVVKDLIGKGAYGIVCSALDQKRGCKVAIKKIENVFDHKTYMKRTLREIRFLRSFKHENIISLRKILRPLDMEFNDIYLVTELMETDLSCIIRSPQRLTDEHCQFFIYQILRGLKYIHDADIVHRDLKPRNLLVNSNCDLKICDFGLARIHNKPPKRVRNMTDYVATRWYRAPEVILSWKKYGKSIDMWAVGCILAELLGRKPIFPGKDAFHQLSLIVNVLGSPDTLEPHTLKEKGRELLEKLPSRKKVEFGELYPNANPLACDLLEKLLQFDPDNRITVDQALRHPYLSQLHCPDDEPSCTTLSPEDWEFDFRQVSKDEVKSMICQEIMYYHPGIDLLSGDFESPVKTSSTISSGFAANIALNDPSDCPCKPGGYNQCGRNIHSKCGAHTS